MTSNEADDTPPPALFDHCVRTYNAMLAEAKQVIVLPDIEDDLAPGDRAQELSHIIVYEGFLTHLFAKLNLSVPYYTSVMTRLKAMNCVRQLRRGGSTTPSQWELVYEPTYEAFARQAPPKKRGTGRSAKDAQVDDQLTILANRVAALEKWQGDVNKSLIRKLGTTEVAS